MVKAYLLFVSCSYQKFLTFLYFWLHWVFTAAHGPSLAAQAQTTLHCGAQVSCCSGFLFQRMGSRAFGLLELQHRGSAVVAHGLSCS